MAGRSGSPEKNFSRRVKSGTFGPVIPNARTGRNPPAAPEHPGTGNRDQRDGSRPAELLNRKEGGRNQTGGFDQEPYDQTVTEQRNDQML